MKLIAVEGFQDHMFQRCEKPSPLLTHLSFLHKKRSKEFFIHFGTFFYKNWSYQQRSKGRPPHLLLLPILRSPWTRIFLMIFGWRPKNCWWNFVWKLKWGNLYTNFIVNKMLYHEINILQNLDVLYTFHTGCFT